MARRIENISVLATMQLSVRLGGRLLSCDTPTIWMAALDVSRASPKDLGEAG